MLRRVIVLRGMLLLTVCPSDKIATVNAPPKAAKGSNDTGALGNKIIKLTAAKVTPAFTPIILGAARGLRVMPWVIVPAIAL